MLNFCGIVVAILKLETGRNFSMSGINSGHHNLSTYEINWFMRSKNVYRSPFSKWPPQYRTNSTLSDFNDISYVDRLWCPELNPDIEKFLPVVEIFQCQNQFGTSLSTHISNFDDIGQCWIFAALWRPFWKWRPVEIFQCRESIRYIIVYPHIKFWWYRTMLNFCGIVAAILKMATGRNFSMSGINSVHHYLPTYQILMISDNVEFFLKFSEISYINVDNFYMDNDRDMKFDIVIGHH
jgi:hypothetical protein